MKDREIKVLRFPQNPIIRPHMDERMGSNISGPSLIRVPTWVCTPLGKYYLYFAHHNGAYIRMAFSDTLKGPWRIYSPGVLNLNESFFNDHIASPEILVLEGRQEILMYYHGYSRPNPITHQYERVAISKDGLRFTSKDKILGTAYWRLFQWRKWYYALAMPGKFYRSNTPYDNFEEGPTLFSSRMRHSAVIVDGDTLKIFYSSAGDCPERILLSEVKLKPDWMHWRNSRPKVVLEPEMNYEGASLPLISSKRGPAFEPVRQLRDPYIFQQDGAIYILYCVSGERGIAIAELVEVKYFN